MKKCHPSVLSFLPIFALWALSHCDANKEPSSSSASSTSTPTPAPARAASRPPPVAPAVPCTPDAHRNDAWLDCWSGVTHHIPEEVYNLPRSDPERRRLIDKGVLVRTKGGKYSTPDAVDSGKAKPDVDQVQMIQLPGTRTYRYKVEMPVRVVRANGTTMLRDTFVCYSDHDCARPDPFRKVVRLSIRKKGYFKPGKDGFPR